MNFVAERDRDRKREREKEREREERERERHTLKTYNHTLKWITVWLETEMEWEWGGAILASKFAEVCCVLSVVITPNKYKKKNWKLLSPLSRVGQVGKGMGGGQVQGGGGGHHNTAYNYPFPFLWWPSATTPLEFFPVTVKFPPWLAESLGMGNVGTSSEHKKIRQLFMDN